MNGKYQDENCIKIGIDNLDSRKRYDENLVTIS